MKNIYGEPAISIQCARKWYRKFKSGHRNIIDESCLGKTISVTDVMLENKVDAIIQRGQKARLFDIVHHNMDYFSI